MPIINSIITDTTNITKNGTYNVTKYTTANVNVEGTQPTYKSISISPSKNTGTFIASDMGADGFDRVTAFGVTSEIDSNIQPENIKKNVQILGVTGTYEGSGGGSSLSIQYRKDANGILLTPSTIIDLSGVTDLGNVKFAYAYENDQDITGTVDFSDLVNIGKDAGLYYTFHGCNGITSVDLSGLKTISGTCGNSFYECNGLINVDMQNLVSISGQGTCNAMFARCKNLTSVNISSLTTLSSYSNYCAAMFSQCSKLQTIRFASLSNIKSATCLNFVVSDCTSLTDLYFPALDSNSFGSYTSQFNNMLSGCSGVTVHFPNNLSSVISSLSGYPNFGGTNTTVLYDLVPTYSLYGDDSNEYIRNPKYDTLTSLGWRIKETEVTSTPYYTAGTSFPNCGLDYIYSDPECTQAVTQTIE